METQLFCLSSVGRDKLANMRFFFALVPTLTSLAAATLGDLGESLIKEIIDLPLGWISSGIPLPTDTLKLSFALKQSNIDGLLRKLDDIANPDSPTFRQWLTADEVADYSAPAPQTVSTVMAWLTSNGIEESAVSRDIDMIHVTLPVFQAEVLLGAQYLLYSRANSAPIARTLSYALPAKLHGLIDTVQPTTAFVAHKAPATVSGSVTHTRPASTAQEKPSATVTCDPNSIFPNCILSKYLVDHVGTNRSHVASYGFDTPANHSDARLYGRQVGTTQRGFVDVAFDGQRNTGEVNLEGNADTQLTIGVGADNQAYYVLAPTSGDIYFELGRYLQSPGAVSSISVSYGNDESAATPDYETRVCNMFAQAGARGITVFIASGDAGVGGDSDPPSCGRFLADFPSSCPYVTAVGGTQFVDGDVFVPNSRDDRGETVLSLGTTGSGGGFSDVFARPGWQEPAVEGYIARLNGTYAGRYNASGRAYPDVSALGGTVYITADGGGALVAGTSASAPVWAALVSLINDYRVGRGEPMLGFLNPALYKNQNLFNDITTGSNGGCGTDGFPATSGWDAVTGLGTPIFSSLRTKL